MAKKKQISKKASTATKKDIFPKVNALVDGFLMTCLFLELVMVYKALKEEMNLLYLLLALIGVVAVAVQVSKYLFFVGGRFVSFRFLKHLGNPLKKKTSMKKFCDQSWQLVIHTSMACLEYKVLAENPQWWQDSTSYWNPANTPSCSFTEYSYLTKVLYVTQLAIWIYTAFSCKFIEEMRKDYIIMMMHHVVTIALVAWSYLMGFLPIGVVVLFVHDVSDIPLDILKMANYMKLEGLKGLFITEVTFATVLVGWVYYRIYLFPKKVIYSSMIIYRGMCFNPEIAYDYTVWYPEDGIPLWFLFNLLLCTLYVLHIWWGFLLVRLLVGVFTKGSHKTANDEYEGDSSGSESDSKED